VQGNLDTLAREFLLYLQAERGCTRATAQAYQADLRDFFRHLSDIGVTPTVEEISVDVVRSWVIAMHQRGLCNNSVARRLAALRSFWRYLMIKGLTAEDVPGQVATPRRERSLPAYLGSEELRRLLDAALQQRTAFCAFRDYAIIATFVYAGLRRGELLNLRVADIDLAESTLRVVSGKGRKTRIIPMVPELNQALEDWLQMRAKFASGYLFVTVRGNRIYPSRLQIIWKKVLSRAGLCRPGVTMHTLRHSFATLLLQSGKTDLVSIQHLLGHTRLDTTAIYLHVTSQQMREAVSAHPLSAGYGPRPMKEVDSKELQRPE